MFSVGVALYKRTADLTESEPRMTSKPPWTLTDRLPYEVPLYSNNQFPAYRTISTGLVMVQPDRMSEQLVDFVNGNGLSQAWFPPFVYPGYYTAANGCPLSSSVHRTYYIGEVGEYFLESASTDFRKACGTFNIKMQCSGGAETTSPASSNPSGFSVDVQTGA